jgi:hypothetical protein
MCKPSQGYYGSNNALSPAAQAILDAWSADAGGVYLLGDPERLAFALKATADLVVQEVDLHVSVANDCLPSDIAASKWATRYEVRRKLLAIATELENFDD